MKVALAQMNSTVGDVAGNLLRAERMCQEARARGAELVLLPELCISGYPPRDLIERDDFVRACMEGLERFARAARVAAILGFPEARADGAGKRVFNSAAVVQEGRVVSLHRKLLLPTYDVFDERRHFEPAHELNLADVLGRKLAVTICEDAWNDPGFWPAPRYARDPVAELVAMGAEIVVNISASPFTLDKRSVRPRMLRALGEKHRRPLLYVNQVGGQDDLVFDGNSMAIGGDGRIQAQAPEFAEAVILVDVDAGAGDLHEPCASDDAAALEALVLGTRDYARKCGFVSAVVGLSGGMDSALVACIAARALGADHVLGVAMPSRYNSPGSLRDAQALAETLGIALRVIPIEPIFAATLASLEPVLEGRPPDVTEENVQARIRGLLLMALSNKLGHLLLSTGNKSEMAVGYCTLYGDMAGGLAVLADVPKTLVYRLAELCNRSSAVIPRAIFDKPPSAELRENQTDQDTLPPYDVLDGLIEAHVEKGWGRARLLDGGFSAPVVDDVLERIRKNEYKRRQAPPGLKITSKAFGPGRRMPIAQGWRE
jgi:NAD+ synthase (glutamine-hydrolysing)